MNTFPESSIMDALKQIDVVIKCNGRTYDRDDYIDNENCYLAKALKEQGFKNVRIRNSGFARIDGNYYKSKKPFDGSIVEEAFKNNLDISVTLILQYS